MACCDGDGGGGGGGGLSGGKGREDKRRMDGERGSAVILKRDDGVGGRGKGVELWQFM